MKKSLLLAALLSLCLVSCGDKEQASSNNSSNSSNTNNSSSQNNSSESNENDIIVDDITTTDYNGYYKDVINLNGDELINGLHTLINDADFTDYDGVKNNYIYTDSMQDSNGKTKIIDFYTHELMPTTIDWTVWDREHVWPKSLFGKDLNTTLSKSQQRAETAHSDLHHVRPDYKSINGWRGNCKYGNVENGELNKGCERKNGVFEPNDISKGDAARIVVYVAIAHNYNIRKVMNGNDETIKETLLSWNKLDPVDDIERNRNNKIEEIQHNRNVFIDSSDLFEKVVNTIL